MTSGRSSSSSPSLRRVRIPTYPLASLTLFRSGRVRRHFNYRLIEHPRQAADRVGYGVGFGYLFPNYIRLREVALLSPMPGSHSQDLFRFSEGRRLWASVMVLSRNASQLVYQTFVYWLASSLTLLRSGCTSLTNAHTRLIPHSRSLHFTV